MIVEMNANYHSSHEMRDLFIVMTVSRITNLKNAIVALDLTEVQVMEEVQVTAEMTEVLGLVEVQEVTDQEKLLPQPVMIVEMNANYHSSHEMRDLFIVMTVSRITNKISNFNYNSNFKCLL
jgi:hypothetical protein